MKNNQLSDFWKGRRVLVAGGSGFIGSHLTELLLIKGADVTVTMSPSKSNNGTKNIYHVIDKIKIVTADLTDYQACRDVCRNQDVVLNTAHVDGSVAFKKKHPAFIFRQNMLITLNMLEAASKLGVGNYLIISSTDIYPSDAPIPTPELSVFEGLPPQQTDGYAWSKRMSEFAAEIFVREKSSNLKISIARPSNIYGPRDYYDSQKGRVIPMFIKKVLLSDDPIVIWGSGEQFRTFLYVGDLACGLLDQVEFYPECEPVNFSGAEEISIRNLAELIIKLSGRKVELICDPSKPSGPYRRLPDITKAINKIDFRSQTTLAQGLRRTIDQFQSDYFGNSDPPETDIRLISTPQLHEKNRNKAKTTLSILSN
jgi:nucleoside-diphosphate-sugar epimerase